MLPHLYTYVTLSTHFHSHFHFHFESTLHCTLSLSFTMEEQSSRSSLKPDLAVKLTDLLSELDGDCDVPSTEFNVKEELIEEVMQELYKEITCTSTTSTNPPNFPSPSTLSPVAFSDVKSESCGASVSDTASTVMAGIEFVGPTGKKIAAPEVVGFDDHGMVDGCGDWNLDDEWLARVLGWDPQELDDQCASFELGSLITTGFEN